MLGIIIYRLACLVHQHYTHTHTHKLRANSACVVVITQSTNASFDIYYINNIE